MHLPDIRPSELMLLWGELVEAYYGVNGFGGRTAEIYAYRFGHWPVVGRPGIDEMKAAATDLYTLLSAFEQHYPCKIKIEGRKLGPWLKKVEYGHRVHVTVVDKN